MEGGGGSNHPHISVNGERPEMIDPYSESDFDAFSEERNPGYNHVARDTASFERGRSSMDVTPWSSEAYLNEFDIPFHRWFINLVRTQFVNPENRFLLLFLTGCFILFLICGIFVWSFDWKAWYSIVVVVFSFCLLIKNAVDSSLIMLFSTALLLAAGIVSPDRAINGFSNPGIFALAILFIIAAGISHTGSMRFLTKYVLRRPHSHLGALIRLCLPLTLISAFVNNVPLVAMMIPVIERWSVITGISPSKLMIPLSYSTIIGGSLTIIGSSTNLIVVGLALDERPDMHFPFFEIGLIGLPIAIIGLIYILFVVSWLIPDRISPGSETKINERTYLFAVLVRDHPQIVEEMIKKEKDRKNQYKQKDSLEDSRSGSINPGFFDFIEVHRKGQVLPADSEEANTIQRGDCIVFSGDVARAYRIFKIKGLVPLDYEKNVIEPVWDSLIVEATVAPKSLLAGNRPIDLSNFERKHQSNILGVWRDNAPIHPHVYQLQIEPGDVLLLVSRSEFLEKYENYHYNTEFVMITRVSDRPVLKDYFRLIFAPFCALCMVVLSATKILPLLTAALLAASAMVIARCLSWPQIKRAVNISVIVTIAASFAMADALEHTGVAAELADNLVFLTQWAGFWGVLLGMYLSTSILTTLLNNASAATVLVPIAIGLHERGYALKPLLYVIMIAASVDFSTPIGYQTNLMVWGPGGYKFGDYAMVGAPLQIFVTIMTVSWISILNRAGYFGGDGDPSDSSSFLISNSTLTNSTRIG
eukprot:TRINITY_DN2927_c0_g2_i1.p1 TRINITY_DN2927_c0_g2~~TRINITY_DN2927_c0_g2_i1.p1  ORF type:complete len:759 (-),score=126.54 TRINITY_DN2927_c0_g2_i1:50-2326(-)